jgi:hypothetical protein
LFNFRNTVLYSGSGAALLSGVKMSRVNQLTSGV